MNFFLIQEAGSLLGKLIHNPRRKILVESERILAMRSIQKIIFKEISIPSSWLVADWLGNTRDTMFLFLKDHIQCGDEIAQAFHRLLSNINKRSTQTEAE